jgi:hypothetical protein
VGKAVFPGKRSAVELVTTYHPATRPGGRGGQGGGPDLALTAGSL